MVFINEEELKKHYAKKPKEILVMDCAYLEKEREKEREENRRNHQEIFEMKRKLDLSLRTVAILKDTISKLFGLI